MTYVEKKHGFKFHFSEDVPCLHENPFGCCGYHQYCNKEQFCIIPENISDAKGLCSFAKLKGFDKLGAVKITRKRIKGGRKIVKKTISKKNGKR